MTAAQRRVFEARRDFLLVQNGVNPYSELALRLRGAPLISGSNAPLTAEIAAEVEKRYFIASQADGDVVKMRQLYKQYRGVTLSAEEVQGLGALARAEEIVLQASSKQVRRIHRNVDLEQVNQNKAAAISRANSAGAGGGGGDKPPSRVKRGFGEDPEDFHSERNQRILRKVNGFFKERSLEPLSVDEALPADELKEFARQLKNLTLDKDSLQVALYGVKNASSDGVMMLAGTIIMLMFRVKRCFRLNGMRGRLFVRCGLCVLTHY